MRKDRNVRTYGRDRIRIIITDVCSSDNENTQEGMLSASSDLLHQNSIFQSSSSSENGALSLNSTGNSDHSIFGTKPSGVQTRSKRKAEQTQNKENEYGKQQHKNSEYCKSNRRAPNTKDQILSVSSSTDNSLGSERICKTRALRDSTRRIDYNNNSANLEKQLHETTAKQKSAVKQINNRKERNELSVNFGDFDNLVVSDFPPVEIRNKDSNLLSVDTSTPVSKRTRHKAVSVTENASDATENKVDRYEEEYEEENGREDDTEESEEDSKTEGNSDDSENEQDESNNYSRVGDLSAIHEHVSDVESGSESDSGNCDIVESESDEEENECDRRITRRMDKSSKSNLERLSINHINQRRNTRMTRVIQCHEDIDDLAELLVESHIDSSETNAILYLQNDELVTDDNQEEIEYVSRSEYHTAHSSRYSDYHSAEYDDADVDDGNNGSGDVGDKDNDEEVVKYPSTPINKYRLCVKFQELQNSFSELLTPRKRKSSKVSLSARAKILILCDQTEPITFTTALTKKMISKCRKIGEGVYGEVFRAINSNGDSIAFKIIPIEGDFEVNDEKQKKFAEILPEVVIAKELSNLRNGKSSMTSNFCEVNNLSCVKGRYPAELLKQWDLFHKNKGSENDRPDVFPEKQLYIMLEFDDCGTDLESYKFTTMHQAKSVLTQVGYALAVAEEALQFEHRDLHWGNVLVRPTDKKDITFRLKGRPVVVPSHGVEACVIDFSMSRLTKEGCTVYTTIPDDDTLFDGKGDYQFDIYREMKKENKGNWEKFKSHSNVLWLHYLADKLVYHTKYPSHSSRQERDVLREFRQFMSTMIDYSSSLQMTADSCFMNS